MKCPSFDELMAFSDGELGGRDAERIEAHIGTCSRCASLVSSQARMEAAWRDSYREPSDFQFERLQRELRIRCPVRRSSLLRWAIPVAAALLVAVAGMKFIGGSGSLVRQPEQTFTSDAGFGSERMTEGTTLQTQEGLAGGESEELPAEQERTPAGLEPEAAVAAAPETVVVTGAFDFARSYAPEEAAGWNLEQALGESPEIGTLEAQTEGAVYSGEEQAAAGCLQNLAVGLAASGGGGAVPAGGSGGLAGSGTPASPSCDGDYGSDVRFFGPCAAEGQADLTSLADDAEPAAAGAVEECPALSQTASSTAGASDRQESDFETRARMADRRFVLFFDAEGTPSSPDAEVLDEAFPGWKDSLRAACSDSMLVVSADEMSEMMLE